MFFKKDKEEAQPKQKAAPRNQQQRQRQQLQRRQQQHEENLKKQKAEMAEQKNRPAPAVTMPGTQSGGYQPQGKAFIPAVNRDEHRRLIVGRDISITGEIKACDHLVVQGVVEAELHGGKRMDIADSGLFRGTVEIEDAEIAGRFEGELTVTGQLTVRAGGKIVGNVHYGSIEVEAGASIQGGMQAMEQPQEQQPVIRERAVEQTAQTAHTEQPVTVNENASHAVFTPADYSEDAKKVENLFGNTGDEVTGDKEYKEAVGQ